MSQTTNGMSFVKAQVWVSPDGSAWTNVSGHGASVAVGGGERDVGEQNTFDGYKPIVKGGDRKATEVTVKFVYTEEDSEPCDVCETAHDSDDTEFWVQYQVKSSGKWFKTGAGILANLVYPQGEAGKGEVILSEFVVKCAGLTKEDAST